MKTVLPRFAAERDIGRAFDYYWEQGGATLASRLLAEYDRALMHIARHPATGSGRYDTVIPIKGLRFWTLSKFPFAVFYVERADVIDVLRVLHQRADLPQHLT